MNACTAITGNTGTTITGTGEPGATVTVHGSDGTIIGTVTVGSDGNWTLTPANPIDPNAQITATQADAAGNTSTPIADTIILKGNNQNISNGDSSPATGDNTHAGDLPVDANTPAALDFDVMEHTGNPVIVTSITITDTPANTNSLQQQPGVWWQNLNWWNILGISNALAVGAGDFTVVTTTPFTINNGSSATFTINFAPTAPGLRDGIVTLRFSDGSVFTFTISGNGTVSTLTNSSGAQNIPVFSPFGLLAVLSGLFWFGSRLRKP